MYPKKNQFEYRKTINSGKKDCCEVIEIIGDDVLYHDEQVTGKCHWKM